MGTCNFAHMKYNMPLIVRESCYDDDGNYDDFMSQYEYDYAKEMAEKYTEGLTFYKVTVRCGYYDGFQFFVEEKHEEFDLDEESPYCIDNEDAHYYFGMCRCRALSKAERERRKIQRWLMSLRHQGYTGLNFRGCMSNGIGVYSAM